MGIVLTSGRLDDFAAAFSVLARLLVQPADEATMEQVRSLIDSWPLAGTNEPTATGMVAVRSSRTESAISVRRDQDALYGITASAKVPPFESVHRGQDRLVFDSQTLQVRDAYRSMALRAPRLHQEPDDHIGLELDFLAHCCLAALNSLEQGEDAGLPLETAVEFSREHVLTWAPRMLRDAAGQAETAWVRGIQLLALGAVQAWADAIGHPENVNPDE